MAEPAGAPRASETTETRLLGGRLLLRQSRAGHRVGTDAVLLAAAVRPRAGELLLDLGSGVGAVGLAVALREPALRVRLVEIVPEMAELARQNVRLNGLEGRAVVEEADILAGGDGPAERGAWVVTNPPFRLAGEARPSPDGWRAGAHHLQAGVGHGDWLRAALRRLAPGGRLALIHRPAALPALLAAAEGRLGALRVLPVQARADRPALRILVGGVAGSRAPLALLPALVLHGTEGGFAPRAAAIHAGEATVDLFEP